jgi:hypothetical protein
MFRKIVFTLMIAVLLSTVAVGSTFAGQQKVTVCHKPGTEAEATLEISAPALNAHLGHGDYEGDCQAQQSAGCETINALVPDSKTDPYEYFFGVSNLDFLPGEIIHVDITVTNANAPYPYLQSYGGIVSGAFGLLAGGFEESETPNEQVSWSADYVVVDGDDTDGAYVYVIGVEGFTLDAVNFSCTPN